MKRAASLTLFLFILSALCGVLLSRASWVGKVGMSLFYQEYDFLKIWWKGGALVFFLLMSLYGLQSWIHKTTTKKISTAVHVFALIAALGGLYFSYSDFREDLSHRLLGERFHIGVYLFWLGWMVVSIYLLLTKKNEEADKNHVGMDM